MQMNPYSIGIGVFVRNVTTHKILIGKRGDACTRGAGCLALPGGHVEEGESIMDATMREVKEETDLSVIVSGHAAAHMMFSIPGCLAVTDHFEHRQHQAENRIPHLTLWMMTQYFGKDEPVRMEPDKCLWWEWMTLKEIMSWKGCDDPKHPQYYWTPKPLWEQILRPWYGEL